MKISEITPTHPYLKEHEQLFMQTAIMQVRKEHMSNLYTVILTADLSSGNLSSMSFMLTDIFLFRPINYFIALSFSAVTGLDK